MKVAQRKSAKTRSLPAPVGGLNARDSLAQMDSKDAVVLENWWPYPNDIAIRDGYTDWSTGYADPVESLFRYTSVSGASSLFAASGTSFYDATLEGAVGAAVVTGLTNAQWQSVNVSTPAGNWLYCFNGLDKPQLYSGSAWTAVDGASTPAITGVTTTSLVHANVFKNRLFLVEKNTQNVWYLPVQSVGGAATKFDLSTIFTMGGYLMAMATWTLDAGSGMDDHAVFLTSEGEVAVYSGTDPSSSSTWALVGVFRLGRPIGRKCFAKVGGDLVVLCSDGLFPLSKGLLSSTINRASALTDKIQNAVSEATGLYGNEYGWDVTMYPEANMLLVNVPAANVGSYQFAQNTISGAWTTFTGWDANCFTTVEDALYFGDDTGVRKAWQGNLDGTGVIVADGLQAFSYFGDPARVKQFTLVRPMLSTDGNPSFLYGLNVDFFPQDVNGVLSYTPPNASMTWGSMVWGEMVWGGSMSNITAPRSVGSVGSAAALRLKVQGNGASVHWAATDFVFQAGGFL